MPAGRPASYMCVSAGPGAVGMPRFLGIDYGSKRIGIAISDAEGRIASPARVLAGKGSPVADAAALHRPGIELDAAEYVVGLPLHMDDAESDQTRLVRSFAAALEAKAPGRVHLWDERLSTHAADALLAGRNLTRKKRKARRDAVAASVILAGYLEATR